MKKLFYTTCWYLLYIPAYLIFPFYWLVDKYLAYREKRDGKHLELCDAKLWEKVILGPIVMCFIWILVTGENLHRLRGKT